VPVNDNGVTDNPRAEWLALISGVEKACPLPGRVGATSSAIHHQ